MEKEVEDVIDNILCDNIFFIGNEIEYMIPDKEELKRRLITYILNVIDEHSK